MIFLLNGTSSSGKSSLAKAIMKFSHLPFIFYSVDFLVNHSIDKKFVTINTENPAPWQKEWFFHYQYQDDEGHIVTTIQDGEKAIRLHGDFIEMLGNFSKKNHPLIIDEIIWDARIYDLYKKYLSSDMRLIVIKVFCELSECERREKTRTNRYPGLARGLYGAYNNVPQYDIEIDTTQASPDENALLILKKIAHNYFK